MSEENIAPEEGENQNAVDIKDSENNGVNSPEIAENPENPAQTEQNPKKKAKKKKLTKTEKWFRFMRRLYTCVHWFLMPAKKFGHTEKYTDRSYIIVGNHLSVLDVVPAAICTDRVVHFMAKKELEGKRIGRWFLKKCDCIVVNRDGSDVRALMHAMKCVKNGDFVCVFPEGTRNKSNDIFLPFKSGASAIAIKTKTPIIPMVQVQKIRLFRKNYYYYGQPFELSEYYDRKLTEADVLAADEKIKQVLLEMYLELKEKLQKKKKSK